MNTVALTACCRKNLIFLFGGAISWEKELLKIDFNIAAYKEILHIKFSLIMLLEDLIDWIA